MPKLITIEKKRKKYRIQARTELGGKLRERFLDELEKGIMKESDILRNALDVYLPNK
jgi:hypothetical protein